MDYSFNVKTDFAALDAALQNAMQGFPRLPVSVDVTREQMNAGRVIYRMAHMAHGDLGAVAIRKGMAYCRMQISEPKPLPRPDWTAEDRAGFRAAEGKEERNCLIGAAFTRAGAEQDAARREQLRLHEATLAAIMERLAADPMLRGAQVTPVPATEPKPRRRGPTERTLLIARRAREFKQRNPMWGYVTVALNLSDVREIGTVNDDNVRNAIRATGGGWVKSNRIR